MKYSITLASFRNIEPLEQTLERLAAQSFTAVEMYGEPAEFEFKKLKETLGTFKLSVCGITGMWGRISKNGATRKLLSDDKTIVASAEKYVLDCIEMCNELGGKEINICLFADEISGLDVTHTFIRNETKERMLCRALPSLKILSKVAHDSGITLVIEPLNRYSTPYCTTAADAISLVKQLDNVGILLDTFHMNIEEDSFEYAICESKSYLKHCHFADNNRKMPGYGHIDFNTIMSSLKQIDFQGFISFEPNIDDINYEQSIRSGISLLEKLSRSAYTSVQQA